MMTLEDFREDGGYDLKREGRTRQYHLAPDLSAWIAKRNLVQVVMYAAETVDADQLHPVVSPGGGNVFPPRMLLALLTYCYTIGIYGSQSIEQRIHEDETARGLCAHNHPDNGVLRRFRLKNRKAIGRCLEKVCLVVCKTKFGCRIDPLVQMQILHEAQERLREAERVDYLALDEIGSPNAQGDTACESQHS